MSPNTTSPEQSVLVGIPAYNEAATIREVVTATREHADEVLVVDDGSEDGTCDLARSAGATLLVHEQNRGYGATLKTIFQYAHESGAAHLVILDADGQHDTGDIPDLVRTQRETGAEIVTGSRFQAGSREMPRYRLVGLTVINLLTNLALRIGYSYPMVSDTQSGLRAYGPDAIETMATAPDIGSGMGASLDILFKAAQEGYDIAEIPTRINYDVENASTRNPVLQGIDLVTSLFVAVSRDRPIRMASAGTFCVLTGGVVLLAVGLFEMTTLYVLVSVLIALAVGFGITLSSRSPRRSDSTNR